MNPSPPLPTTKDRILDAAESLFADLGFEATSLRAITAAANVNLAAVNYHFQSKDALLDAVVDRRAIPINAHRLVLLDQYEAAAAGSAIPVEKILDAFFRPVLESGVLVPKLMMRMQYLEPASTFQRIFQTRFRPIAQRFGSALGQTLPHLPPYEVLMRMHFVIGCFAQLVGAGHTLQTMTEGRFPAMEPAAAVGRLIQFAAAGLRAPAYEERHETK